MSMSSSCICPHCGGSIVLEVQAIPVYPVGSFEEARRSILSGYPPLPLFQTGWEFQGARYNVHSTGWGNWFNQWGRGPVGECVEHVGSWRGVDGKPIKDQKFQQYGHEIPNPFKIYESEDLFEAEKANREVPEGSGPVSRSVETTGAGVASELRVQEPAAGKEVAEETKEEGT